MKSFIWAKERATPSTKVFRLGVGTCRKARKIARKMDIVLRLSQLNSLDQWGQARRNLKRHKRRKIRAIVLVLFVLLVATAGSSGCI